MIKVVDERLCDTIKATEMIPNDFLINAIDSYAKEAGIPVDIETDQIKVGGGIFVKAEPCITIYNSKFRSKYHNYDIVQRQQGNYVFISVYLGGNSSNYMKQAMAKESKSHIFGMLTSPNHQKVQAEEAYYNIVKGVIVDALCSSGKIIS